MTSGRKLLVVGPSWVGDMVMAHSLYRLLAARDSGVSIHVLAPAWSLPLLARMPEVTAGIELPAEHGELALGKRLALGRALRRGRFDRAIVLPRSLKAALVPFFARIPVRTGFRGEWRFGLVNDMRPFEPAVLDTTVRRFLALGVACDEPVPPRPPRPRLTVDQAAATALVERLAPAFGREAVALMPGAEYGPAKRWPTEHFGELARRLAGEGFAVWVLGSAKESPLAEEIVGRARSAHRVNLCGRTSLTEAADVLSRARVAVSNDSGLMHVAAAVGTHVVALYGSSSPAFTPPLTERATVLYLSLDCSPCFARDCPLIHHNCLRGIEVETVLGAARAVLGPRPAARA